MKYIHWLLVIIVTIISILFISSFILNNDNYIEYEEVSYDDFLTLRNKYPHNTNSFTQGLFFYNDKMYESTRFIYKISTI